MGLGEGNHYGESQPGLPQGDRAEHLGVSGRCCTRGASPTVKPIQTLCTQMSSLIGLSMAPRCPRRSAIYSQNSRKPTRFIHRHPRTSCSSTRKRCALDVPVIGSGVSHEPNIVSLLMSTDASPLAQPWAQTTRRGDPSRASCRLHHWHWPSPSRRSPARGVGDKAALVNTNKCPLTGFSCGTPRPPAISSGKGGRL